MAATVMELIVDPTRVSDHGQTHGISTGIYVRARLGDKWGSHDIIELSLDSLRVWLRSRGGENEWAENVVCMLLGHEMSR